MSTTVGDAIALADWAQACGQRGNVAYLLLDGAQAEGSHLRLQRWKIPYASLFDGKPEQVLPEIAPLLVALRPDSARVRDDLIPWALSLGFGAPCLSWYESPLALDAFASHLRNFHHVGLSDGQHMLMRWYDTRILPLWLQTLSTEQAALFRGGMSSISYLDRFGQARTVFTSDVSGPPSRALPLGRPSIVLDDRQLGLLVDVADLDTLLNQLRLVIPDETAALPPRVLLEFVTKYQQQAIGAGLEDIDRQTQYVLLALYTSGKGTEHPAMQAVMADPPASLDGFYDAIQAMPADVWHAGMPLWSGAG